LTEWKVSEEPESDEQVTMVDARFLSDSNKTCCIQSNGDIILVTHGYDEEEVDTQHERIGNIEGGVLAAEWTVDDQILAVVTGLHNMTRAHYRQLEAPFDDSRL
jgi:IKI3 family